MRNTSIALLLLCGLMACQPTPDSYDILITNAMIYDGSGEEPYLGSIGINADTIAAIGDLHAVGESEIDAQGKAVAPGFHQYAELGQCIPDRRRALDERPQARRHP